MEPIAEASVQSLGEVAAARQQQPASPSRSLRPAPFSPPTNRLIGTFVLLGRTGGGASWSPVKLHHLCHHCMPKMCRQGPPLPEVQGHRRGSESRDFEACAVTAQANSATPCSGAVMGSHGQGAQPPGRQLDRCVCGPGAREAINPAIRQ